MKLLKSTLVATGLLSGYLFAAAQGTKESFRTDFLNSQLSWETVSAVAADEAAIDFYYWGGDDRLNVWLERTVAPDLASMGVELRTHRITATSDVVDLVLAEDRAGKRLGEGSVDAIWVNGENFYTLAQQNLLFGSFAQKLPNAVLFDWDETSAGGSLNLYDFGFPTLGREMPWSGEQYVCAVNRALMPVAETPHTFAALEDWLETHPGTFTYVKPPHYLGNTFVQEALYEMSSTGATGFQQPVDSFTATELAALIEPGMVYLRRIAPLLAQARNGIPRYPENDSALMQLFQNSQIAMECQFGLYHVATKRASGQMPDNTEEIIFPRNNMIKNKNYLVIPSNAPHPAAALVFANYMSSLGAQKSKLAAVGYPLGLDLWMLNAADQAELVAAMPPHFGVTQAMLDSNIAPDTHASLVRVIEGVWKSYVLQQSDAPFVSLVEQAMAR